jgi:hypothetical protein
LINLPEDWRVQMRYPLSPVQVQAATDLFKRCAVSMTDSAQQLLDERDGWREEVAAMRGVLDGAGVVVGVDETVADATRRALAMGAWLVAEQHHRAESARADMAHLGSVLDMYKGAAFRLMRPGDRQDVSPDELVDRVLTTVHAQESMSRQRLVELCEAVGLDVPVANHDLGAFWSRMWGQALERVRGAQEPDGSVVDGAVRESLRLASELSSARLTIGQLGREVVAERERLRRWSRGKRRKLVAALGEFAPAEREGGEVPSWRAVTRAVARAVRSAAEAQRSDARSAALGTIAAAAGFVLPRGGGPATSELAARMVELINDRGRLVRVLGLDQAAYDPHVSRVVESALSRLRADVAEVRAQARYALGGALGYPMDDRPLVAPDFDSMVDQVRELVRAGSTTGRSPLAEVMETRGEARKYCAEQLVEALDPFWRPGESVPEFSVLIKRVAEWAEKLSTGWSELDDFRFKVIHMLRVEGGVEITREADDATVLTCLTELLDQHRLTAAQAVARAEREVGELARCRREWSATHLRLVERSAETRRELAELRARVGASESKAEPAVMDGDSLVELPFKAGDFVRPVDDADVPPLTVDRLRVARSGDWWVHSVGGRSTRADGLERVAWPPLPGDTVRLEVAEDQLPRSLADGRHPILLVVEHVGVSASGSVEEEVFLLSDPRDPGGSQFLYPLSSCQPWRSAGRGE